MIFQKKFFFFFSSPPPPPHEVLTYGSFLFFGIPVAFWEPGDSWGIISSSLSSLRLVGGGGSKKKKKTKNDLSKKVFSFFFFRPPPPHEVLTYGIHWDTSLGSLGHSGNLGILEGSPESENGTNKKNEKHKIENGRRGKQHFIFLPIYNYIYRYIYILGKAFQGSWGQLSSEKRKERKKWLCHCISWKQKQKSHQTSLLVSWVCKVCKRFQKIYIHTWYYKTLYFHKRGKMGPPFGGFLYFYVFKLYIFKRHLLALGPTVV